MKRKLILFAVLTFIGMSSYAQIDDSGNYFPKNNKELFRLKNTCSIEDLPFANFQFDNVRALSEVNRPNKADAYPWISNDGLRLYFSMGTDSVNTLVIAKREHKDSTFNEPQSLSINSSLYSNRSLWLTNDELNIFYVIQESNGALNDILYHASRTNIEEEFEAPTQVVLTGGISGFISSPSFSEDMEELYLYNSSNNSNDLNILFFEKVNNYEYILADTLVIPDGYKPGPGQLGQDDLKYYVTLADTCENQRLYMFNRESVEDSFDSIYYLNNDIINDSLFRNHQPSISNNGNCFIFTRSSENSWSDNDLYIAYNNSTSVGLVNFQNNDNAINVYPNPTVDYLTFESPHFKDRGFNITIFNTNGVLIESILVDKNSSKIIISTTKYHSGIYLYTITSSDSYIGNGKFIVQKY